MFLPAGSLASDENEFEDFGASSLDPQTKLFWEIGYNKVKATAPIHIHFAQALPSNYRGRDADWDFDSWKTDTNQLLRKKLFPLIGAYEHYYFLIDYHGYDADDDSIVAQARIIGGDVSMTKDGFTGI